MAWFGKIVSLDPGDSTWRIGVNYYNDAAPDKIVNRVVIVPLRASRADVIAAIKDTGADVMGTFLLVSQNIIGQVVNLP